jgi:dihydropteroate synthase
MKLHFKNKILDLSSPAVMGILNVTPDSFYDGGKFKSDKAILLHTEKMITEGANIIDIGAYSTRPGANEVPEQEELRRLIPVIALVKKNFQHIIISADTFRSNVAKEAVQIGADMINDISGGNGLGEITKGLSMFETVAKLKVPYVLMHIQGIPKTMQQNPQYKNVTREVMKYFEKKIKILKKWGVKQIILDPGFGFGKTVEHNYELLKNLNKFKKYGYPILAGMSRKSMISKVIDATPATALNGTTVANTIALMNGANLLRVHDVKEAIEAVKIVKMIIS